jgi:hypothetical protein
MQFTKRVYQDVYPAIDPSKPELSLSGRVAIITGASRGIGAKVRVIKPTIHVLRPSVIELTRLCAGHSASLR